MKPARVKPNKPRFSPIPNSELRLKISSAKMIGAGGHYHVTSDHPGVQEESNRVANGPMMTNAFREIIRFDGRKMGKDDMKAGDVHLLATIEPDSGKIVDEAKKAKDRLDLMRLRSASRS